MTIEQKQHIAVDQQLVRAALDGHTSTFGTVVERCWMVIAFVLSKVPDADPKSITKEDLLEDEWIQKIINDLQYFPRVICNSQNEQYSGLSLMNNPEIKVF